MCELDHQFTDNLMLVHYYHPDCVPLKNIMRQERIEAFSMAENLAKDHPLTAAFYRFADFDNYYDLRLAQDAYLFSRFATLGGEPEEMHPLSFVVEGSDYLHKWFGEGGEVRLPLNVIEPRHISFTIGDSGSEFQQNGNVQMLTLEQLNAKIAEFGGDFEAFHKSTGRNYIEAQLWSDKYI